MTEKAEFMRLPATVNLEYKYSTGRYLGRFYKELRDNKRLVANKCGKCGRVLFPPRIACPDCMVRASDEWVEVGPQATLIFFYELQIPGLAERHAANYLGVLALDGTEAELSCFEHRLMVDDPGKLREGMRMEPVFNEEGRTGRIRDDILGFKPIEG